MGLQTPAPTAHPNETHETRLQIGTNIQVAELAFHFLRFYGLKLFQDHFERGPPITSIDFALRLKFNLE